MKRSLNAALGQFSRSACESSRRVLLAECPIVVHKMSSPTGSHSTRGLIKKASLSRHVVPDSAAFTQPVSTGYPRKHAAASCAQQVAEVDVHGQPNLPSVDSSIEEVNRIVSFLEGKHILVMGATGFLAKVVVEKILREQPGVGGIWLLAQPKGSTSAAQRVAQLLDAPLFDRLRDEVGQEGFQELASSKVHAVEGNISDEGLGIKAGDLNHLRQTIDIVINSAATTTFDEQYDVAIAINTCGAKAVAEFAASCSKATCLLHVSTAYVNGCRTGLAKEDPFAINHTISSEIGIDGPPLDVLSEVRLAEAAKETEGVDGQELRALGIQRAQLFGWHDTYTFTKAMGEMLVQQVAAEAGLPLAIIRPSIVEGTFCDPVPGWIEGMRMADPIIMGYGKGKLPGFVAGGPAAVLDCIPADFVSNAIIAAMFDTGLKTQKGDHTVSHEPVVKVYHVASSGINPMPLREFCAGVTEHFTQQPVMGKAGTPVVPTQPFTLYPTADELVSATLYPSAPATQQAVAPGQHKQVEGMAVASKPRSLKERVMQAQAEQLHYLAKIYSPYTFYKCHFDGAQTTSLFQRLNTVEQEMFGFDVSSVDWRSYFRDVHIPGLRRYVAREGGMMGDAVSNN